MTQDSELQLAYMKKKKTLLWLYMFLIKHIRVETSRCKKENVAHGRGWWELRPYCTKEETDTSQAQKYALFPKMTFPLMSPTTGPKQPLTL